LRKAKILNKILSFNQVMWWWFPEFCIGKLYVQILAHLKKGL
jgi:hypothetical protein